MPAADLKSTFVIILKEVPKWKPEFYSRGMTLAVTQVRRNPVEALSPDIKSGNYLNNILGVAEAVDIGADDCLMLNPDGIVTEASNSNVLFVIDGKLVTPNVESGVLRGITKAAIAKIQRGEWIYARRARGGGERTDEGDGVFRDECDARGDAGGGDTAGERRVAGVSGGRGRDDAAGGEGV